jgi:hypothetical protein
MAPQFNFDGHIVGIEAEWLRPEAHWFTTIRRKEAGICRMPNYAPIRSIGSLVCARSDVAIDGASGAHRNVLLGKQSEIRKTSHVHWSLVESPVERGLVTVPVVVCDVENEIARS